MKRQLGLVHIKKFSKRKTSLRADGFIVGREVGAAGNLVAGLEPLIFSDIRFNPVKCVQPDKLRHQRAPVNTRIPHA
jgi:hypothetical protein